MTQSTWSGGSLVQTQTQTQTQMQTQATPSPPGRRMRSSAPIPDLTQQQPPNSSTHSPSTNTSSPQPQTSQPGTAPRNVRFTTDASASSPSTSSPRRSQLSHYPNLNPSPTSSTPSSFSPVPLTRVLSNGSTPMNHAPISTPTALASPSPRFPIARPLSTCTSASISTSASTSRELSHVNTNANATQHRSFSSGWNVGADSTPIKPLAPPAAAAVATAMASSSTGATSAAAFTRSGAASSLKSDPTTIERRALPPMTRQEVARRLRTNAVLLVLWWISSRTQVYKYTSDHLSDFIPSLSAPLNLLEKGLFILLCYNVADSMRSLNNLSSLTPPHPSAPSKSSPSPHLRRTVSGTPYFSAPVQSSPKTRSTCFASPSILPGGSPLGGASAINTMCGSPTPTFRASAMSLPQPPSPQTPASSSRPIVSSALRKSYVGELRTTASPSTQGSPFGARGVVGTPTTTASDTEEMSSLKSSLNAYMARHEPLSPPKISVDSQEVVDRMFESL